MAWAAKWLGDSTKIADQQVGSAWRVNQLALITVMT